MRNTFIRQGLGHRLGRHLPDQRHHTRIQLNKDQLLHSILEQLGQIAHHVAAQQQYPLGIRIHPHQRMHPVLIAQRIRKDKTQGTIAIQRVLSLRFDQGKILIDRVA